MEIRKTTAAMLIAVTLGASGQTGPGVVTRCTSASGHAYFLEGGLVTRKDTGWKADGIEGGQIILMRADDARYDLIFTDASGQTRSTKGDGGTVLIAGASENRLVLIVNYPDSSIETWYFALDVNGAGSVTFSQARYGESSFVRKHSLMHASCRR